MAGIRRLAGALAITLPLAMGVDRASALEPFTLDGRPFFPVGVAGAPLDLLGGGAGSKPNFQRMFAELASAGMNLYYPMFLTSETENVSDGAIHDFIPDTCETRAADPGSGLATMRRSGLAVLFPAFIVVEKTTDLLRDQRLDELFAASRLTAVRRCYSGIPLFAYQTYDDAPLYQGKGIPILKLEQLKQLLGAGRHCAAPYVLVIQPTEESLGHVVEADLKSYLSDKLRQDVPSYSKREVADGVGMYTYPIPFSSPATVGAAVERFSSMQTCGLRPLAVLQGFGMSDVKLHPNARRPTPLETRFMAFHAIIHGAGGIMWWGTNSVPSASDIWGAIKRTARDIRRISPWLVGPDSPVRVSAPGAEVLLKSGAASEPYLLIAANPAAVPANVTFSVPTPAAFRSVRRIFSGQNVPVSSGQFSDRLPAFGVEAYEVSL
jgi:hypothetical protein